MDLDKLKIFGGMFITPRDIQIITGINSVRSSQREHTSVRDALGKKSKRLTIKEYCDYWEINYLEMIQFLNANR